MGAFMSTEEVRGVVVNGKVISTVVGLLTIVAMTIGAVSYVTYQTFEIAQVQEDVVELKAIVKNDVTELRVQMETADRRTHENYQMILDKFDALTTEVTKLTIALGNIQYKQDNDHRRQ